MVTNEEVGRRIRQARGEMGWNQAELGRQLVPSRSHAAVSDIERGKTKLDVEGLSAIAVLLKKPLEYFIPTRATPSLTYQRSDRDLSAEQQQKGNRSIEDFKSLARQRARQRAEDRPE